MRLQAWRIVKEKHAATAFSGEGAYLYGGRWNSPGVRIVYTSGTKSLAALETLVHLNPPVMFRYVAFRVEFNETLMEKAALAALPADWSDEPPPPSARASDLWVKQRRSAGLELPSIIQSESNYLRLEFRSSQEVLLARRQRPSGVVPNGWLSFFQEFVREIPNPEKKKQPLRQANSLIGNWLRG